MKHFSKADLESFYKLLDTPLTRYNCGKLCSPDNMGTPFCCIVENAVPLLYREEYKYLSQRSDLWKRWKPKSSQNKKLKAENENHIAIFCECKGAAFCERENRSISCRTFPLEPYITNDNKFVALIFMKEFRDHCPLLNRIVDIQQKVIENHYQFWEKIFELRPEEFDIYKGTSKGWRISAGMRKEKLPLLYPRKHKPK